MVADDLTRTTPQNITAFLTVGQTAGLAPSTLNTKLRILANMFAHFCDEGVMAQQPVRRRQHRLLTPKDCPKPSQTQTSWHSSR